MQKEWPRTEKYAWAVASWLRCPSPLATGCSHPATLQFAQQQPLHRAFCSSFSNCFSGLNFVYVCVSKSKRRSIVVISFHWLFPGFSCVRCLRAILQSMEKMFPVIVLREKTALEMCPNPWFHSADAFAGDGRGTSCVKHVPKLYSEEKEVHNYVLHTTLEKPQWSHNPP